MVAPAVVASAVVASAEVVSAVVGLVVVASSVAEAELPAWLAELDALTAAAAAARLALVERAVTTRTVEKSQAGSVTAWVRQHAPSLASLGAAQIAKTVDVCRSPELAALRRAVLDGRVQPGAALVIATEFERLRPQLHEAARPTVLDAMVEVNTSGTGKRAFKGAPYSVAGKQRRGDDERDLVDAFLATHGEFHRLSAQEVLAAQGIVIDCGAGDMRLSPQKHGTDGFYAAVLERAK